MNWILIKASLSPFTAYPGKFPHAFHFNVALNALRYLGVFVTSSFGDVFSRNFRPLIDKWQLDMIHWSSLPLSLIGSVNLVKKVILPKFLHLFQHNMIFMRKYFFQQLDQAKLSFLLVNKMPAYKKTKKKLSTTPQKSGWSCTTDHVTLTNFFIGLTGVLTPDHHVLR